MKNDDKVLATLGRGPAAMSEIAAEWGLHHSSVMKAIKRLHDAKRIHIHAYRPGERGIIPKVWALGEAPDAAPPKSKATPPRIPRPVRPKREPVVEREEYTPPADLLREVRLGLWGL